MNPARSIGPAMVSGHWEHYWIYLIAPIVGMVLSFFVWKNFKKI
jgi:aquaporin Z